MDVAGQTTPIPSLTACLPHPQRTDERTLRAEVGLQSHIRSSDGQPWAIIALEWRMRRRINTCRTSDLRKRLRECSKLNIGIDKPP